QGILSLDGRHACVGCGTGTAASTRRNFPAPVDVSDGPCPPYMRALRRSHAMCFRMIYDNALAQAAYLIGCQRTGEAIVIDPERDIDRYIAPARQETRRIPAVAETHIHADCLSGTRELAEKTGAKAYLSDEGDADW